MLRNEDESASPLLCMLRNEDESASPLLCMVSNEDESASPALGTVKNEDEVARERGENLLRVGGAGRRGLGMARLLRKNPWASREGRRRCVCHATSELAQVAEKDKQHTLGSVALSSKA